MLLTLSSQLLRSSNPLINKRPENIEETLPSRSNNPSQKLNQSTLRMNEKNTLNRYNHLIEHDCITLLLLDIYFLLSFHNQLLSAVTFSSVKNISFCFYFCFSITVSLCSYWISFILMFKTIFYFFCQFIKRIKIENN